MTSLRTHPRRPTAAILGTTAIVGCLLWMTPRAVAEAPCQEASLLQASDCPTANAGTVVRMPVGENVELVDTAPGSSFQSTGFSISIDGTTVAGAPAPADPQRPTDIAAAAADIDVRYDGLAVTPILNVSTTELRTSYRAGDRITFRASTNYPSYLERAEVVVVDLEARNRPVIVLLPVAPNGEVSWTMPETGPEHMAYALRVYDRIGRINETAPLDLLRSDQGFKTHTTSGGPIVAAGEGEDRTKISNIPIRGGQVTVAGSGLKPDARVSVMGENIIADPDGKFVLSRILAAGEHLVTVEVIETGRSQSIVREVEIEQSEWFYVGVADLTFGRRIRDDAGDASPDPTSGEIADGRLAFYVNGRTHQGIEVTASADTGEGPLSSIFKRLDEKDPRHVLQRLDPGDHYPTYGDDSTAFDDTPSSGRLYLRLETDTTSLTFGDFQADVTGDTYLSGVRSLYGAELRYASPSVTSEGNSSAELTAYAAQPDTLPQRDVLRGTGGSVFFLSRQDINGSSETIAIEVTDPVTGRIISRRHLVAGADYEMDYIQGVVIMTEPVPSTSSGTNLITNGTGEYDVNLVVQYEYTPTTGGLEGASLGGRIEVRPNEELTFGFTAMQEQTGLSDQKMLSADARLDLGEKSYVGIEIAQTEGPGFGRALSSDGGLTVDRATLDSGKLANAYRLEAALDFEDLGSPIPGFASFYAEHKDDGFSTLTEEVDADQVLYGIEFEAEPIERLTFGMEVEWFESDDGEQRTEAEIRAGYQLSDDWAVSAGLSHLDQVRTNRPEETGNRNVLGVRVDWTPTEDLLVYGFGQATLAHSGEIAANDRVGVGLDAQFSDQISASAEVSDGSLGVAADARLTYSTGADSEYYLGYSLDPALLGAASGLSAHDRGSFVLGAKTKKSEHVATFAEHRWDLSGDQTSLTRAYGITYTPSDWWTISGSLESGEVRDDINGDFDRTALSFGVAFTDPDALSARARLEYRADNGYGIEQDRETWAFSGAGHYRINDDWRLLAGADILLSDSAQDSFRDGEYIEASVGYAYRPVLNDKLNILARYSYLRDLPGEDQITVDGSTNGPKQISHVLSVDANYDLTPKLTIGGKYGYRISDIAQRGTDDFASNQAHLGILRADWHLVHKWDLIAEGRMLYSSGADSVETNLLLGTYRHMNNTVRIGAGYEFGNISDKITDLNYKGENLFINLLAKF